VPSGGEHGGFEFRGQRHQESGRIVVAQPAQGPAVRNGGGRRRGRG